MRQKPIQTCKNEKFIVQQEMSLKKIQHEKRKIYRMIVLINGKIVLAMLNHSNLPFKRK